MIEDIKLKHCSGINCCMITIPSGIQVLNASFRSIKEENKVSKECKYAFLADDKWLSSEDITYNVQFLEYVPVVLEWTASDFITVDPNELRRRNSEGYPTLYGTKYYYCLKGYQGNPYLPTGCQGQLLQLPTSFHFLTYYSSSFHYFYLFMCNYMNENHIIWGKFFFISCSFEKYLANIFVKLNLDFLLYLMYVL